MTWAISHVYPCLSQSVPTRAPRPPLYFRPEDCWKKQVIDQTNKHAEQQKRTNIDQQNVLTCTNYNYAIRLIFASLHLFWSWFWCSLFAGMIGWFVGNGKIFWDSKAFHMDGWWIDLMKQLWTIHGSFHAQKKKGLKPDIYVSCVPSFWGDFRKWGLPPKRI